MLVSMAGSLTSPHTMPSPGWSCGKHATAVLCSSGNEESCFFIEQSSDESDECVWRMPGERALRFSSSQRKS